MIQRIHLHNFMSHADSVIELAEGLTVLVGPNNSGKSAVVEALRTLCNNESGKYAVRHGERECSVAGATDDGHRVEWRRSGNTVSYCDTVAFTPAAESTYVLPWPAGISYTMFQGNCSPPPGGHQDTFAYDFDMGQGDPIYAARAGFVFAVNDGFSDNDHVEGHENNVFIRHNDQTIVRYTHLQQDSAMVVLNQAVMQGEILGLAGNSGNSAGPHLHLQLFRGASFGPNDALPMTFSNAIGTTETTGELIEGQSYEAG